MFKNFSLSFLVLIAFSVPPVLATKIDPMLFEELVLSADLVALVECETAGGMTARFKIVESIKGPKAGTSFVLSWPANFWGEKFPIALCGQRSLVTAYKVPPSNLISTTMGGPVPLWWRHIPSDYGLPLMQGEWRVTPEEEKGFPFQQKLKKARALLALNPAGQETALLKALTEANLFPPGKILDDQGEHLRKKFAGIKTSQEIVDELIRLAKLDGKTWGHPAYRVLVKGGTLQTLAVVKKLPKDKQPWTENQLEYLELAILVRQDKKREPTRVPDDEIVGVDKTLPREADLKTWRAALEKQAKPDLQEHVKALVQLTYHDPASVVDFFCKWDPPPGTDRIEKFEQDLRNGLVSYFAWRCGKEREKHLARLVEAKNPWVRVTGAIYLCFENQARGMAALKNLTALEGDPGAWAALTLVRRGHKDAVPRALQLFPKTWREEELAKNFGSWRENMQNQVLVLLSNSARAGKAPQFIPPKEGRPNLGHLETWWRQNQNLLVLGDPWLEILVKQKID